MAKALPASQHQILKYLGRAEGPVALGQLERDLGLPHPRIAADCQALAERGYLESREEAETEYSLGPNDRSPLPERAIARALNKAGGELDMSQVPQASSLAPKEVGAAMGPLLRRKWATKDGRRLVLTDEGKAAVAPGVPTRWGEDEKLLIELRRQKKEHGVTRVKRQNLRDLGIDLAVAERLLRGREEFAGWKVRARRLFSLSPAGRQLLSDVSVLRPQINLLTEELLKDGAWRDVEFRPYDVALESAVVYPGKSHPLRRVIEATRTALLEMGFTELKSPLVESAFWDFDALFQPQDHPAREMQDTYYVARPAKASLPDDAVVTRVGETHESGGETGSTGWGYTWKRERAARTTLRTHTTATTVRAVAAHPEPPGRYFTVGLVFRREASDTRHLCAFYQVDGIIIDERGSLASLLGTLRTLYTRIGLKNVHFAPDFFPYTEPSVEVRTWLPGHEQWLELCGAGIFRPEVTQPLGCAVPVLAWGGGLERIAMALYGLDDMRALYQMDVDVLRRTPLCPR